MENQFTVKVILRFVEANKKSDGTYPLKLVVNDLKANKRKMFGLPTSMTKQDFDWLTQPPTGRTSQEYKDKKKFINRIREEIYDEIEKAEAIAKSLKYFSLSAFTEAYTESNKTKLQTVKQYLKKMEDERSEASKVKTAIGYRGTSNILNEFFQFKKKNFENILFPDITAKMLQDFENWFVNLSDPNRTKSKSSVGVYLRNLRAAYNEATSDKIIDNSVYPFCHKIRNPKGYKIPHTRKTLKGITENELQTLWEAEPQNEQQQVAKDFWFFSYFSNGMNIKDIALLRFQDIYDDGENGYFQFVREKTKETRKDDTSIIEIPLQDHHLEMFAKYGNKKINGSDYVFDIVRKTDTVLEQNRKKEAFTRSLNQHIKILAENNGITKSISYQWARHTNTQIKIDAGVHLDYISKGLGHSSIETTRAYTGLMRRDKNKEINDNVAGKVFRKKDDKN